MGRAGVSGRNEPFLLYTQEQEARDLFVGQSLETDSPA